MVFCIHNIVPLVESSRGLLRVHTDDKVPHDSVSLLLHLGLQMFLLALIILDLDPKLGNLFFVIFFSFVEFFDIIQIELLPLFAAHLLPFTEAIIDKLLIQSIGSSYKEFLGNLVLFDKKPP